MSKLLRTRLTLFGQNRGFLLRLSVDSRRMKSREENAKKIVEKPSKNLIDRRTTRNQKQISIFLKCSFFVLLHSSTAFCQTRDYSSICFLPNTKVLYYTTLRILSYAIFSVSQLVQALSLPQFV